ncbi:MAG: DUF2764 domain-containing protein [Cytophagales bacterium]|nr:DUF2764 domain-containing protein [Cytophagales bacterium]
MTGYYYLVSSLPVLDMDSKSINYDITELYRTIRQNTEAADRIYLRELLYINDIKNLVSTIAVNRQLPRPHVHFQKFSSIPKEIIEEYHVHSDQLPSFIRDILETYEGKFNEMSMLEIERLLLQSYFEILQKSKNKFNRNYAAFELSLRNMMKAINSRTPADLNDDEILDDERTSGALEKSSAKDFGLSEQFPFINQLIVHIENRAVKELDDFTDRLRWNFCDELTSASFFEIDNILAYIIKLDIISRHIELDDEKGRDRLEYLTTQALENLEITERK